MRYWLYSDTYRHDQLAMRRLRLTIALSLLVHLVALVLLPRVRLSRPGDDVQALAAARLEVQLAAASKPPESLKLETPRRVVPRALPRPHPPTSISPAPHPPALTAPSPATPVIPTPPVATPPSTAVTSSRPAPSGDLWSYIQARRRERGEEPTGPSGSERSDPDARLAANLPLPATGVATQDRLRGGGMFEIRRMNYDDAAFEFFGWNDEMGRKTPQLVEVRLGNNSDMRIAVVRKMIAIIREHTQGDFTWRSSHRENGLTLSARPADNAELESFLLYDLRDQFDDQR
jgi:hypothetical protein